MENAIECVDLHKSFGPHKIHKGIDLQIVKGGAITYIIGPSGTGKSVLLKQLCGLMPPTSGKVYVNGQDLTTMKRNELVEMRKKFGILFQNAALLTL